MERETFQQEGLGYREMMGHRSSVAIALILYALTCTGSVLAHGTGGAIDHAHYAEPARAAEWKIPVVPFVYVAEYAGIVGGRPARFRSYYLNREGRLQISEHGNNTELVDLREGRVQKTPLFDALIDLAWPDTDPTSAPHGQQNNPSRPIRVTEYYPPKTRVRVFSERTGAYRNVFLTSEMPADIERLISAFDSLQSDHELCHGENGLYVRAERVDPAIAADVEIGLEALARDENLQRVLTHESALVRVGPEDFKPVFAGRLVLVPGRPVLLKLSDRTYALSAYRFAR